MAETSENISSIEVGLIERIERRVLLRFSVLGTVIGFLFAIIVSLVGYTGSLLVETSLAEARANLTSAAQSQRDAVDRLNETIRRAEAFEQRMVEAEDRARQVSVLVSTISDRIESVYSSNISISEDILQKIDGLQIALESRDDIDVGSFDVSTNDIQESINNAKTAASRLSNARFQIGMISYRTPLELLQEIKGVLFEELGFSNRYAGYDSIQLQEKEAWFSDENSILYYDESSKNAAQSVRASLERITGQNFSLTIGAGFGIDASERANTIIIHLAKS